MIVSPPFSCVGLVSARGAKVGSLALTLVVVGAESSSEAFGFFFGPPALSPFPKITDSMSTVPNNCFLIPTSFCALASLPSIPVSNSKKRSFRT